MILIIKYNEPYCWQYKIRKEIFNEDLKNLNLSIDEVNNLRVHNFDFNIANKENFKEIKEFIEKYEWLGNISSYPTHYFTARYNGILGGVLIFNMPNAFSKLLGENTPNLERLLSRGACASWTPKNLASSFIMWSIKWMVSNTKYRLFTAYSDPMAKELGTIYQACNFIYLGQTSGSQYRYKEPSSDKWVSDRKFRNTSSFKKYAKDLGIEWQNNWSTGRKMNWINIPDDIENTLREEGKKRIKLCEKMKVPPKHKYAYIKGRTKKETKELLNIFKTLNPKLTNKDYPKNRGE